MTFTHISANQITPPALWHSLADCVILNGKVDPFYQCHQQKVWQATHIIAMQIIARHNAFDHGHE
jgi:hypothetical protein